VSKKIWCFFCPKLFENTEDLFHHMELDHIGMDSKLLQEATLARDTKKQLGDYINDKDNGAGLECSRCFEMFSSIDKLNEHGKREHNHQLDPKFIEQLQSMIKSTTNTPPICARCNLKFLGLITTKIDKIVQHVCFNCYEKYFGTNALTRITIGTPDEMIIKLKKPL